MTKFTVCVIFFRSVPFLFTPSDSFCFSPKINISSSSASVITMLQNNIIIIMIIVTTTQWQLIQNIWKYPSNILGIQFCWLFVWASQYPSYSRHSRLNDRRSTDRWTETLCLTNGWQTDGQKVRKYCTMRCGVSPSKPIL